MKVRRHRKARKLLALLLTLMMVFSISSGAFGEDSTTSSDSSSTTGTITITNAQTGVTYTAYKIFDVTIATGTSTSTDEDGNETTTTTNTGYSYTIAADSAWLTSVQAYAEAKTDPTDSTTSSESTESGGSTESEGSTGSTEETEGSTSTSTWSSGLTLTLSADGSCYVVTIDEDTFSAAKFAKYLLSVLSTAANSSSSSSGTSTSSTGTSGSADTDTSGTSTGTYTISNLDLGYYLVAGTTTTSSEEEGSTTSATVYQGLAELTTTDTAVTIYDKYAAQTISKSVDATSGSVQIGENITFYIYGTVPSLTGYTSYTYSIKDSMTDGLTFTEKQMAAMDIELYQDTNNSVDMTTEDRGSVQLYVVSSTDESGNTTYSVVQYVKTSDTSVDSTKTYYTKDTSDDTTYTAAENLSSFISGTTYYEAVTVGSLTYTAATAETTDTNGNTVAATGGGFTLSLDMTELQDYVGYEIGILYKATANENADAQTETNTATLTYSNDPDDSSNTSTNTATATVYTSNIKIYKVDSSTVTTTTSTDSDGNETTTTSYTNATKLSGASFVLIEYKSYSSLSSFVSGTTYYTRSETQNADGGYTYTEVDTTTTTSPNSNTTYYVRRYYQYQAMGYTETTDTEYASGTTYYTASTDEDSNTTYTKFTGTSFAEDTTYYEYSATGDVSWTTDIDEATVLTTNENGTVTIQGLDDLTYYLLEIEAPDGYNLLTEVVTVKVAAGDETYSYSVYVENSSGSLLPSTGGMGRTLLYVIGIIIIAGACVTVVIRRRRISRA